MCLATMSSCCETIASGGRGLPPGQARRTLSADLNQQIFRTLFGVFHEHIEVAVIVEDARVEKFVLHVVSVAALVGLDQIDVGKRSLRVLVQVLGK